MLLARKDVWAGILMAAFGVAALVLGAELPIGRAGRMGAGYFPRGLAILLLALGVAIAVRGIVTPAEPVEAMRLRPLLGVVAGGMAFAFLIGTGGIFLAAAGAIAGAAIADRHSRWAEVALLAALAGAFCAIVFVWALRLPIPIWFR